MFTNDKIALSAAISYGILSVLSLFSFISCSSQYFYSVKFYCLNFQTIFYANDIHYLDPKHHSPSKLLVTPCSKIFLLCKLIASKFGLVFRFNYVGGLLIHPQEMLKENISSNTGFNFPKVPSQKYKHKGKFKTKRSKRSLFKEKGYSNLGIFRINCYYNSCFKTLESVSRSMAVYLPADCFLQGLLFSQVSFYSRLEPTNPLFHKLNMRMETMQNLNSWLHLFTY